MSLLFLLFNRTGEKCRTSSAWKCRGGGAGQKGEMTQTMYAHVNKWIIKKDAFMECKAEFTIQNLNQWYGEQINRSVPTSKIKKSSNVFCVPKRRMVKGVNSSMIYLICCKNCHKCHNVPLPSTTIKKFLAN
jgi:hypothetical protein